MGMEDVYIFCIDVRATSVHEMLVTVGAEVDIDESGIQEQLTASNLQARRNGNPSCKKSGRGSRSSFCC